MHWMAFGILLYVTTVLQTAFAPFLAVHGVRPDFLAIVAVYYALIARREDALLACWFIGLAADLTGLGYARHSSVGVAALSMGLAGLVVVAVRDLTFRDSVVTQLLFTFAVCMMHSVLVGLFAWYAAANRPAAWDVVQWSLYTAIYTALLAPYGHWLLRRMRNMLGLAASGRVRIS